MLTRWQVECLHTRIVSLKTEIVRVADKDHPYPEPDIIYKALNKVVDSRLELLEEATVLYSLDTEWGTRLLQATYSHLSKDLQDIIEVFSFADRVDSPRIPFEIMRALSWAAKTLTGQECKIVVRLDPAYNYSIVSCQRKFDDLGWEGYWNELQQKEGRTQEPPIILLLGFPSSDAGSILLHTLAAHEFGHQLVHKNWNGFLLALQRTVSTVKKDFWNDIHEYIVQNIRKQEGESDSDAFRRSSDQVDAKLLQIAKKWLIEIFSDFVAARLVGPAFIAAFDRFLMNEPSESHPPGSVRRHLVYRYLKQEIPHIMNDAVWHSLFDLTEQSAVYSPTTDDTEEDDPLAPIYPFGVAMCEESLKHLPEILRMIASPLEDAERLPQLVADVEDHINNLAPPSVALDSNHGTPNGYSFWLVMYAAWHYRIKDSVFRPFAKRYGWDENLMRAEDAIGNLVLHALQSLELRFQWSIHKNNEQIGGSRVS